MYFIVFVHCFFCCVLGCKEKRLPETPASVFNYEILNITEYARGYIKSAKRRVVDLFGCSTKNSNFGINEADKNTALSNSFVDWGQVFGNTASFHTFSENEIIHLTGAEYSSYSGKRDNCTEKCGLATITVGANTVKGLVLIPDGQWTVPAGLQWKAEVTSYDVNSYTTKEWKAMEDSGAIFLPAAGQRQGSSISSVNTWGFYWTSTLYYGNYNHNLRITPTGCVSDSQTHRTGIAVRLVMEVKN